MDSTNTSKYIDNFHYNRSVLGQITSMLSNMKLVLIVLTCCIALVFAGRRCTYTKEVLTKDICKHCLYNDFWKRIDVYKKVI